MNYTSSSNTETDGFCFEKLMDANKPIEKTNAFINTYQPYVLPSGVWGNGTLMGIPLVKSKYMTIQSNIPKRHHRQKRIQKKWLKRYGTKRIPNPDLFYANNMFVGHPETLKKIVKLVHSEVRL